MQSAKDTFYVTLRNRLAVLNPVRTIVVRGVTRPGALVEENELVSSIEPVDAFCLRWSKLQVHARALRMLVSMQCQVRYSTDGTEGNAGMDRGRLLAGMDAELASAVDAAPQSAMKMNFASGGPAMGTRVFWGDVTFADAVVDGERLSRVAMIEVFTYQEAGEL
jgi:hypothetical protein